LANAHLTVAGSSGSKRILPDPSFGIDTPINGISAKIVTPLISMRVGSGFINNPIPPAGWG